MTRLLGIPLTVVGALLIPGRKRFARASAASRREMWGRFDPAARRLCSASL